MVIGMNKYLIIDAKNIYSINYVLMQKNNKAELQALTDLNSDGCRKYFEDNGIPFNFQYIFIKLRALNRKIDGYEYLTNIPIEIYKNKGYYSMIDGRMHGDYPGFRFKEAKYCTEYDIISFFKDLKDKDLFDNYLNALGELFQIKIVSNKNRTR